LSRAQREPEGEYLETVTAGDGRYAGCRHDGYGNEYLRRADSDFEIAPAFARGKKSLDIRLDVKTDGGESAFSDFATAVYCYEPTPAGAAHSEK
jgi:hypothetical protein